MLKSKSNILSKPIYGTKVSVHFVCTQVFVKPTLKSSRKIATDVIADVNAGHCVDEHKAACRVCDDSATQRLGLASRLPWQRLTF